MRSFKNILINKAIKIRKNRCNFQINRQTVDPYPFIVCLTLKLQRYTERTEDGQIYEISKV